LAAIGPAQAVRAADIGYRDFSYSGTTAPTGQKPQSKLWIAGGAWWGALFSTAADAFTIHELNWATRAEHRRGAGAAQQRPAGRAVDAPPYVASAGRHVSSASRPAATSSGLSAPHAGPVTVAPGT
jgi:hypothetical protein